MGWSGGSDVAEKMIKSIQKNITDKKIKKKLYETLLDALTDEDWDCVDDVCSIDTVWDEVANKYLAGSDE